MPLSRRPNLRRKVHRSFIGLVVVALALVSLVSAPYASQAQPGTPQPASPPASPAATPVERLVSVNDKVTIELTDAGFNPSIIQATNGHDLTVTLVNTGSRRHAFQIDKLHVDVSLEPGERRTITITSPPLGDFTIVSDAPGDEHMSGTLIFYI